jgi:predicted enzyme related to lactoylglutathione lyase
MRVIRPGGKEIIMKRVTGLGGVFFKAEDPQKIKKWYNKHLGIDADEYGFQFKWIEKDNVKNVGTTVWSPFPEDTGYFDPSDKPYMFNYRVENLEKLLAALKQEGVTVIDKVEEYEYGKFGWIMDPEGNKIELWEPPEENL